MVYNAMKLFMEINPTLFDECSADYTESQNTAGQREAARQQKWAQLEEQARRNLNKMNTTNGSKVNSSTRPKVTPPAKIDEVDPAAQDNQQRLDALKLQDDGSSSKDTDKSSSTTEGVIPVSMQ